jgi:hemoglobin
MNRISRVLILTLAVAVAGLAHLTAQTGAKKSLYDSLGGKAAIVKVVDDFVGNCAADTRINSFFAATAKDAKRLAAFKTNLVNQICEASGGPCKYAGKDMKTAHAGMGITNAHFDALVEDLQKSLNKFKVAAGDQKTLLGVLGPMRAQIVERK